MPDRICIFQDYVWLKKEYDEEYYERLPFQVLFGVDHCYYTLTAQNTPDNIESAIRESSQIPVHIGFITTPRQSLESILETQKSAELQQEDFEHFARNVSHLFFGAYDGESFVVWEKEERNPEN